MFFEKKRFILQLNKTPISFPSGLPVKWSEESNWKHFGEVFPPKLPGANAAFILGEGYFFIDIDHCLENGKWSQLAVDTIARFPGAAVEVSRGGDGLHIIGRAREIPSHKCKRSDLKIELYTEGKLAGLTFQHWRGNPDSDHTDALAEFITELFPPGVEQDEIAWTDTPREGWHGPQDDAALLTRAKRSKSAAHVFDGKASFAEIWEGTAIDKYHGDQSSLDLALAQHLAFWTGANCERMERMMRESPIARRKWDDHPDYLRRTILMAASAQAVFYVEQTKADLVGSPQEIQAARPIMQECIRNAENLSEAATLATKKTASFWIENQGKTNQEILAEIAPKRETTALCRRGASVARGAAIVPPETQIQHFAGCVYILSQGRVLAPNGMILKPEQFNALYGGWEYVISDQGKTTKKAFDAFTNNPLCKQPLVEFPRFAPSRKPLEIFEENGSWFANVYVPAETKRSHGDPGPFLRHMSKLFPVERDRKIILSYMAACVQHIGVKFQWAPLIQGTEGNGKTLVSRVIEFALGERFCHFPAARSIAKDFNSWLSGKLFIGVEDIKVAEDAMEVMEKLKPMITNTRQGVEPKGIDQYTDDICANFILNSNHKDAIRKTENDRRFAVFFTAQQCADDLKRDGMDGDYFPDLYRWLREGGYAIVNEFLHTFEIPEELNPAGACHRAPETSSTWEAVDTATGRIEQHILEAIEEERTGFRDGWIDSISLANLLKELRMERAIPPRKRGDLLASLGYHPIGRATSSNVLLGGRPMLYSTDPNRKPQEFLTS